MENFLNPMQKASEKTTESINDAHSDKVKEIAQAILTTQDIRIAHQLAKELLGEEPNEEVAQNRDQLKEQLMKAM